MKWKVGVKKKEVIEMGSYIVVLVKKEKFEDLKNVERDLFIELLAFFDGRRADIMNDVLEDWGIWDGILDYHSWLAYLDSVMFKLDIERQFYDYVVEEEKESVEEGGYIRSVGEVFEDAREMIWKYERLMLLKRAFEILKDNLVIVIDTKSDYEEYKQKGYRDLSALVWGDEEEDEDVIRADRVVLGTEEDEEDE